MKTTMVGAVLLVNALGAMALDNLSGYTNDIPKCASAEFKKGLESKECKTDGVDASTIDCLCRHAGAIAAGLSLKVDTQCSIDLATAVGSLCGIWLAYSTNASDLPQATSILADKINGDTPNTASSPSPTGSAGSDPTTTGASASDASATESSKSSNLAAMPTAGPGLVGLVGGVAAIVGMLV